jgi:hypothetical protein
VGDDSAYLGGKKAHFEGCLYRYRDTDSKHTLQNRFKADAATEQRVEERKAVNKAKNEVRKAAKAAKTAEGDHVGEDGRVMKTAGKRTVTKGKMRAPRGKEN